MVFFKSYTSHVQNSSKDFVVSTPPPHLLTAGEGQDVILPPKNKEGVWPAVRVDKLLTPAQSLEEDR